MAMRAPHPDSTQVIVKSESETGLRAEYERVCGERDRLQATVSTLAAIIQNPNLTHKQARTLAGVTLALEAQRPPGRPTAAFRLDPGELAKRAGLIPPTPEGDQEARRKAWNSGRKQAGQVVKDLADAGAFDEYHHQQKYDDHGKIISSSVVIRTDLSQLDLLRIAARSAGTRTLQQPRGRSVKIDRRCPECGSLDTALHCRSCDAVTDTAGLIEGPSPGEEDGSTDFKRLETRSTEYTEVQVSTGFKRLEIGDHHDPVSIEPTMPWQPMTLPGRIPKEMELRRQFVGCRLVPRLHPDETVERVDKIPINPHTGEKAKPNESRTWGSIDEARAAVERYGLHGLGFILSDEDPFTFVDLDGCRDPETGVIDGPAASLVRRLGSWSEVSQSRKGVHVLVDARKPGTLCRGKLDHLKIEIYEQGRFIAFGDEMIAGQPQTIEKRQAHLEALYQAVFPHRDPPPRQKDDDGPRLHRSEEEILEKARSAANGAKFRQLWDGGWEQLHYSSQSEADAALCYTLLFNGADPQQVTDLFRLSGLYREKWERADYRDRTIQCASKLL